MFESTAEKTEKKVNVKRYDGHCAGYSSHLYHCTVFYSNRNFADTDHTGTVCTVFSRHHLRKVERCGVYRDLSAFGYGRTSGVQWF